MVSPPSTTSTWDRLAMIMCFNLGLLSCHHSHTGDQPSIQRCWETSWHPVHRGSAIGAAELHLLSDGDDLGRCFGPGCRTKCFGGSLLGLHHSLVNGTLNGTTEIVVGAGDNLATFDDIMVEEAGLSYDLEVTCSSTDGSIYLSAMSKPFHVHDYPEVGMLRETDIKFTFKGPLKKVEGILSNFNNAMGTVSCKGCPAGMGGSRKKRDTSSQSLNIDPCFSPLTEGC